MKHTLYFICFCIIKYIVTHNIYNIYNSTYFIKQLILKKIIYDYIQNMYDT